MNMKMSMKIIRMIICKTVINMKIIMKVMTMTMLKIHPQEERDENKKEGDNHQSDDFNESINDNDSKERMENLTEKHIGQDFMRQDEHNQTDNQHLHKTSEDISIKL